MYVFLSVQILKRKISKKDYFLKKGEKIETNYKYNKIKIKLFYKSWYIYKVVTKWKEWEGEKFG